MLGSGRDLQGPGRGRQVSLPRGRRRRLCRSGPLGQIFDRWRDERDGGDDAGMDGCSNESTAVSFPVQMSRRSETRVRVFLPQDMYPADKSLLLHFDDTYERDATLSLSLSQQSRWVTEVHQMMQ